MRLDLGGVPLLDVASYARRGPSRRDRLSPGELAQIQRTVDRVPEVMVKVLSSPASSLSAVRRHLEYIDRHGNLDLETDEGPQPAGKAAARRLLEDWDLDLETHRRRGDLRPTRDRSPPRLVHKILFSMPPGTPPRKVLEAVKNFARDEFALQHPYAMVLHTDEPHPHVHLVVKAMSEQGVRLNIRKDTLRRWRSEFASQLRGLGVAANATDRAVRGSTRPHVSDGVFRTAQRGESRVVSATTSSDLAHTASAKAKLVATRESIQHGWAAVSNVLRQEGRDELAERTVRFVRSMPPPRTDQELILQTMVRDRHPPIRTGPTR